MIASCYKEEDESAVFITSGCGCCSSQLYPEVDREEILKQLKRNVDIVKESCAILDIDYLEFVCE